MKRTGRMMAVAAMALAAASMLVLTGCEKGGGGGDKPANVAGVWKGSATLSGYGRQLTGKQTITLNQDGKKVTGVMGHIPLSGSVDGDHLKLKGSAVGVNVDVQGNVAGDVLALSGKMSTSGYTFNYNAVFNRSVGKAFSEGADDDLQGMLDSMIKSIEAK